MSVGFPTLGIGLRASGYATPEGAVKLVVRSSPARRVRSALELAAAVARLSLERNLNHVRRFPRTGSGSEPWSGNSPSLESGPMGRVRMLPLRGDSPSAIRSM